MKPIISKTGVLTLLVAMALNGCKKDSGDVGASKNVPSTPESLKLGVTAVNSSWSIDWNNRANGATYTQGFANADFGNTTTWYGSGGAYTTNGINGSVGNRVTLVPNLDDGGGLIANTVIGAGTAYELDYDLKFHSQFNWGKGGKIGFGLGIGEHNTGGDPGTDGNGGTLRLMWYNTGSRVFIQPYVYYKDQPGQFGNTFNKSFPSSGSLVKGQWYHVHLYVKSNTGSSTNGRVQVIIDGTVVLDQSIRWTTNDAKRLIDQLTWHTFRGGNDSSWWTNTTDYIYYDNLQVNRISTN